MEKSTIRRENGYFVNPFKEFRFMSPTEVVRFVFRPNNSGVPNETALNRELPYVQNFKSLSSKPNLISWIGHASCLLKMSGVYILTDPIFSENCSAIQWNISRKFRRYRQPGMSLEDIPHVDAVVISHNHYDHLDYNSVWEIKEKFKNVQWFVPLGLKSWFTAISGIEEENVHEFNWWGEKSHTFSNKETLKFTCVPAQHWSMRKVFDKNYTLWSGWTIKSNERNVYFAGDTGYNDHIFKEIGHFCGTFDLSLIPIGAYKPREFLKCQHVDPEEAVLVHKDTNSKLSLGIHWGTFRLGKEYYLEPLTDLEKALNKHSVPKDSFVTFKHGETREF